MAWVIIGCTILIIVCLGGGMRLAKIILGTIAILGAVIFLFSDATPTNIDFDFSIPPSGVVVALFLFGFLGLMANRQRQGPPRA
jgi:hypothetical protein